MNKTTFIVLIFLLGIFLGAALVIWRTNSSGPIDIEMADYGNTCLLRGRITGTKSLSSTNKRDFSFLRHNQELWDLVLIGEDAPYLGVWSSDDIAEIISHGGWVNVLGACDYTTKTIEITSYQGGGVIGDYDFQRQSITGTVIAGGSKFEDGIKNSPARVFHLYEVALDEPFSSQLHNIFVYVAPYDYLDIIKYSAQEKGMYINIDNGMVEIGDHIKASGVYVSELYTLIVYGDEDVFITQKSWDGQ